MSMSAQEVLELLEAFNQGTFKLDDMKKIIKPSPAKAVKKVQFGWTPEDSIRNLGLILSDMMKGEPRLAIYHWNRFRAILTVEDDAYDRVIRPVLKAYLNKKPLAEISIRTFEVMKLMGPKGQESAKVFDEFIKSLTEGHKDLEIKPLTGPKTKPVKHSSKSGFKPSAGTSKTAREPEPDCGPSTSQEIALEILKILDTSAENSDMDDPNDSYPSNSDGLRDLMVKLYGRIKVPLPKPSVRFPKPAQVTKRGPKPCTVTSKTAQETKRVAENSHSREKGTKILKTTDKSPACPDGEGDNYCDGWSDDSMGSAPGDKVTTQLSP